MDNSLKDLRVLVVEDSFETINFIRSMLREMGIHQTFTAKNGREELDFLGTSDDMIDVVRCDWNMPELSGIEILRQLRTVDPNFPFIMITGAADRDSVSKAKAAGATSYIVKPFSTEQLPKKLQVVARMVAVRSGGCKRARAENNENDAPLAEILIGRSLAR
jgi:two-component system chemotaxis response regulator CheY